jgi:hypothetical protein
VAFGWVIEEHLFEERVTIGAVFGCSFSARDIMKFMLMAWYDETHANSMDVLSYDEGDVWE